MHFHDVDREAEAGVDERRQACFTRSSFTRVYVTNNLPGHVNVRAPIADAPRPESCLVW